MDFRKSILKKHRWRGHKESDTKKPVGPYLNNVDHWWGQYPELFSEKAVESGGHKEWDLQDWVDKSIVRYEAESRVATVFLAWVTWGWQSHSQDANFSLIGHFLPLGCKVPGLKPRIRIHHMHTPSWWQKPDLALLVSNFPSIMKGHAYNTNIIWDRVFVVSCPTLFLNFI